MDLFELEEFRKHIVSKLYTAIIIFIVTLFAAFYFSKNLNDSILFWGYCICVSVAFIWFYFNLTSSYEKKIKDDVLLKITDSLKKTYNVSIMKINDKMKQKYFDEYNNNEYKTSIISHTTIPDEILEIGENPTEEEIKKQDEFFDKIEKNEKKEFDEKRKELLDLKNRIENHDNLTYKDYVRTMILKNKFVEKINNDVDTYNSIEDPTSKDKLYFNTSIELNDNKAFQYLKEDCFLYSEAEKYLATYSLVHINDYFFENIYYGKYKNICYLFSNTGLIKLYTGTYTNNKILVTNITDERLLYTFKHKFNISKSNNEEYSVYAYDFVKNEEINKVLTQNLKEFIKNIEKEYIFILEDEFLYIIPLDFENPEYIDSISKTCSIFHQLDIEKLTSNINYNFSKIFEILDKFSQYFYN